MEEEKPAPTLRIYIYSATATLPDGTELHATPLELQQLNEEVEKTGKIPVSRFSTFKWMEN